LEIAGQLDLERRQGKGGRLSDLALREGKGRGPLFGIPIILKDNINTHDQPTTAGSVALEGSVPLDDAFITKELREAGAIILEIAGQLDLERRQGKGGRLSDLALREGKGRGPLFGIPIILKDNINTHDQPTTAGSVALEGSVPLDDAFITKELREAGAIIL